MKVYKPVYDGGWKIVELDRIFCESYHLVKTKYATL